MTKSRSLEIIAVLFLTAGVFIIMQNLFDVSHNPGMSAGVLLAMLSLPLIFLSKRISKAPHNGKKGGS